MGRFSEKQLTLMTIVVAVLVTGLFAALVFKDLGSIDSEKQKIADLRNQIQAAEMEIQRMPARETDVIVYREIVKRDSAILPDESEINEFINVIGEFEKASGVLVTQVHGLSDRRAGKEAILKIPLKLKLQGTTEQFIKFINLFENYDRFVSISGFTLTRGKGRNMKGETQHAIALELETYRYNAKGGPVARVDIPNYERRTQELAIQQRINQSKPAFIEKYQLASAISRRDPLLDPREDETPVEYEMSPEERYKMERELLEELGLEIALVQLDVRTEEKLRSDGNIIKISAASKAIDERVSELDFRIGNIVSNNQITIAELKDEFIEKVVKPFEEIKKRRSAAPTEVVLQRRQVHEWLVKMKERFEAAAYKDVVAAFHGYQRLSEGRKVAPDAVPLQEEMRVLAQQAEKIARFEGEPLVIEGVIIDPERKSFAIINGQILSEGENVDAEGDIKINRIRSDQIEFVYEGVPILKYLRNK